MTVSSPISRRRFMAASLLGAGSALEGRWSAAAEDQAADADQALIAITFDLEMSRNFPRWEDTHWDYEKGNLNEETKRYTVEACRRVRERGGVLHTFAVGRVFEQENHDWLNEIVEAGHPVGNHTYDHVNVTATRPEEIQFRFRRAPWLIEGKSAAEVISENIRLTNLALRESLGIEPSGFRTPGGFSDGLAGREDVQQTILAQGFRWVSSKYPAHPLGEAGRAPSEEVLTRIVEVQPQAQPFAYPSGLVEVPMSPVSDISAFRGGRWPLKDFLLAVRLAVSWAIDHGAVFDFLGHPSCLYVTDPEFRAVKLICDLVEAAGPRAAIVDLDRIARRLAAPKP
ncbi:MAG: polysaccharide deacetylase family protein [Pirellulales bacterium]